MKQISKYGSMHMNNFDGLSDVLGKVEEQARRQAIQILVEKHGFCEKEAIRAVSGLDA